VPQAPAGTIGVFGDLKQMSPKWLVGSSFLGYGVTLTLGIGIPIPILNEEIAKYTVIRDEEIYTQVVDYSEGYPMGKVEALAEVNYKELKSGSIKVKGKDVPTASLSSYSKALEIAEILKKWIKDKKFYLTEFVQPIPGADSGVKFKPLTERPFK